MKSLSNRLDLSDVRLIVAGSGLLVASWMNSFQPHLYPVFILVGVCFVFEVALGIIHRFRKEKARQKGQKALEAMVCFLESLNGLPPKLSMEHLQRELIKLISATLRSFDVYSRLWVVNRPWNTLRGEGDHPELPKRATNHLPVSACPAFALRRSFQYSKELNQPCPSEQFSYARHLCIPVTHEDESFGVLFLATDRHLDWSTDELHLFSLIAQATAFTLQRKSTFDHLEEKISDLRVSFEVGTTSLATFMGSTLSLEETTVRILDGVLSLLKVDRASLMLWSPVERCLQTQWVRGGDFQVASPLKLPEGQGMAGWALQSGKPYWAEYAMTDPHYFKSGQPIQSLLCFPLFTSDQKPLGVINAVTEKVTRNFSEQEVRFLMVYARQAAMAIENAQLHQANRRNIEKLNELNDTKSRFLSLVSHDLRGPLTGIRGFGELLKEQTAGPLNASQFEIVEQLEKQVELQERMVDDLLDFARMEKGNFSVHLSHQTLAPLLEEEVEKSQREAKERGIQLTLSMPHEGLPVLEIDEDRIRQLLWNLIHNSLKFTNSGGRVNVRATIEQGAVTINVEDTGIGLSEETQGKVFETFFQITPGGSRGAQGLGLGLAICREIVLAHKGRISAKSPGLGLGTTISFTLPIPSINQSKTQSCQSTLAA